MRRALDWSVLPAALPAGVLTRASSRARSRRRWAEEGIVAVELFLARDGELLVNELAPRPHNSFHAHHGGVRDEPVRTARARDVCNLPLVDATLLRPRLSTNLLGDLWTFGDLRASTARSPSPASRCTSTARRAPRTKDGTPHRCGRHHLRGHRQGEGRARGAPRLRRCCQSSLPTKRCFDTLRALCRRARRSTSVPPRSVSSTSRATGSPLDTRSSRGATDSGSRTRAPVARWSTAAPSRPVRTSSSRAFTPT
ncbi:MAG: ATP-grasp domain-containing protein [Polyangiales bacterium]